LDFAMFATQSPEKGLTCLGLCTANHTTSLIA
jgi:hypothetical protein